MSENFIPKIVYGSGDTTITFTYPPQGFDPLKRQIKASGTISTAANGLEQTSNNYIEEVLRNYENADIG